MNLRQDSRAFGQLIPLVLSVVITFAVIFMGSFINGTISKELKDTLPVEQSAWNSTSYWDNGTFGNAGWVTGATNSSSRNETGLPVPLSSMNQSTTLFRITANRTEAGFGSVNFHLYANNVLITNRTLLGGGHHAYNATLSTISSNITTSVYYLNWSWRVNDTDNSIYTINDYWRLSNWRSPIDNSTAARMDNGSINFDTALDIVQVCIIITILAAAIGAIFLFTKYGR